MKNSSLHDRVMLSVWKKNVKPASGIVIPDAATEKPDQGEIIAVGNGKTSDDGKLQAMNVKVGDGVLFGKYSGQSLQNGWQRVSDHA